MIIGNILWPFGTYILWSFGNIVRIWYIFHCFGKLCEEKSGNPGELGRDTFLINCFTHASVFGRVPVEVIIASQGPGADIKTKKIGTRRD
jgi:hypothetical protein